jgi:putative oxidoreductase
MDKITANLPALARLLMSSFFIWAGVGKLMDPSGTAEYFATSHVPIAALAVWVVILIQVLGGLAILVGYKTGWAAGVLAIYCLITAFGVHLAPGDQPSMTHFYKNLVMAGGFLYVLVFGSGALSIDGRSGTSAA